MAMTGIRAARAIIVIALSLSALNEVLAKPIDIGLRGGDGRSEVSTRRGYGVSSPLLAPTWARAHEREASHSIAEAIKITFADQSHAALEDRFKMLTQKLKPVFVTLPKNAQGRLDHATARYALHRYFTHEYSTHIKGLDSAGGIWNASSPIASLEDRVPAHVQDQFEKHVESRGFDLNDLSLLASTLEAFIHEDGLSWLKEAYKESKHTFDEVLSRQDFELVLDTFLWILLGKRLSNRKMTVDQILAVMPRLMPDWPKFQAFARKVLDEVGVKIGEPQKVTFAMATKAMDSIMKKLGQEQLGQCNDLTDSLIARDISGTGRVTLSDFYDSGQLHVESPEYLKRLGSLDPESDGASPQDARVIISNYIASESMCITSRDFFALCCPDACEGILSHLEHHIAAPTATPEQILKLVAALPSRTRPAPRNLSDILVRRIYDVAEHHGGGKLFLHSRLFAQWLHHAYPYECQFPSTPSNATFMERYMRLSKADRVTAEEVEYFLHNRIKDLEGGDLQATLPWLEEEMVFNHVDPSILEQAGVVLRSIAFCAVLFVVVHLMLGLMLPATKGTHAKKLHDVKFYT